MNKIKFRQMTIVYSLSALQVNRDIVDVALLSLRRYVKNQLDLYYAEWRTNDPNIDDIQSAWMDVLKEDGNLNSDYLQVDYLARTNGRFNQAYDLITSVILEDIFRFNPDINFDDIDYRIDGDILKVSLYSYQ